MKESITLLDGGVGTSLMEIASAKGLDTEKPVWMFNMTNPEIVAQLHQEMADAGAKIILANTFGANRFSVEHFSDYPTADVVREGVKIAHEALKGRDVKICLAAGALAKLLKPVGRKDSPRWMTEEECADVYTEQLGAGVREGVDCILLQTFMDLHMMEVAVKVAMQYGVPVYSMLTFEKSGRTMMGDTVEKIVNTLTPLGISGIGMNCSMGPAESLKVIEEFHEKAELPLMFKPNAGKPITDTSGKTTQPYTAEQFAKEVRPALDYVDYIGGCCGANASYIRAIREMIA